jgi:hypothetical protein
MTTERPLVILIGHDPTAAWKHWYANGGDGRISVQGHENANHPETQREYARSIVRMVNGGGSFVIFTNSDWILRELNRLMLASQLPTEKLAALGLTPNQTITPDKIAIYEVDGETVTRLRCDSEGMSMGSIDDATNSLNHDEQAIYLALDMEKE